MNREGVDDSTDASRNRAGPFPRRLPLALGLALLIAPAAMAALPEADPAAVGFDPRGLEPIGPAVERAIARGEVPGAVVAVVRRGKVAYARAFGRRAVAPRSEPMTRETIFDLASLTKPIATAASIMLLVEQGQLRLDDPIAKHLPEFDNHGKGEIRVEQLLRHRGGLIADNRLSDFEDGPDAAWRRIADLPLIARPGERYVYSDVGFLILGRLVERVAGVPLDRFAAEHFFRPLEMTDTRFRRIEIEGGENPVEIDRFAPTEKEEGRWLRGVVHDPRARALGGVAGHAGLFGTADDLAVYASWILAEGKTRDGRALLAPATIRAMGDPGDTPARARRGLGWDVDTPHSAPRGDGFGPSSYGHTGFTGTSVWIDPATGTAVVVLASRLHPGGKGDATPLRAEVATLVASAIIDPPPTRPAVAKDGRVACGIDVLARRRFAPLRGKRVGLVTNQTGRTADGSSTIDVLFHAPDVKLVVLFSPEHGIRGLVDAEVPDSRDEATGLPIVSLYGKDRKPSPERLEGIDILVYDIQDIGARFYTYISTLGLILEAARANGTGVLVLDRPNPIGGEAVDGPVRDPGFASFIAYHDLPVRHGMTVGELARLFNAERSIGADLRVIPCEGWHRADLYDRTGLAWVNPSPNMRSLAEALLYPGIGLLEASNLATGRGTDTPFERLGAPWIEPLAFARALNESHLEGVRVVPIRFTPRERQYSGKECGGVQVLITDWSRFEPLALGTEIAVVLRRLYPDRWEPAGFLKMTADKATQDALLGGKSTAEIRALWTSELDDFRKVRGRYLLYD